MSSSIFDMIIQERLKGPSISIGEETISTPEMSPKESIPPRAFIASPIPSPKEIPSPKPPPPQKPVSNDPASSFSPFDVVVKEKQGKTPEGWLEATARNITRTGSRMVESILGLPGDLVQFGKWLGDSIPKPPEWMRPPQTSVDKSLEFLLDQLPTQQSLQGHSEGLTGGYTAPTGRGEEFSDEIFKTLSNLLSGTEIKPIVQGATRLSTIPRSIAKVGRMAGQAVASESAKEGIKLYGGGEGSQEIGKMGTLFLTSLTLPRMTREVNPDQYLRSLYAERNALIPQGTTVTPSALQTELRDYIANRLQRGGPTPEKKQVASVMEEFLERLSQGPIEMEELIEMYQSVNRNRANVMAATDLDKAGVRAARGYWGDVANMFNTTIEGFLAPISQRALDLHRSANSGWASMARSKVASNFILDKISGVPLKTGIATLFGGGIFQPVTAAKALAGTAIGAGALKGSEMLYRFLTNPTLRHYYNQVILNAVRENAPAMVHAVEQLDKQYFKELQDPKSSVNRQKMPPPAPQQTKQQQLPASKIEKTSLLYS